MTRRTPLLSPLALAIALASQPSMAVTLGPLETHSVLGNTFEGRIPVSNLGELNLDDIKPALASHAQHRQLNVEPQFRNTRFRIGMREEGGQAYIDIRSPHPVKEPILNFVISTHWPTGHLAKEFVVLLDPPKAQLARPKSQRQRLDIKASDNRYRTQSGDSLWLIAKSLKPAGISVQRAMDGIFQLNPGAFIKGDRNRLRRGYNLTLPQWGKPAAKTASLPLKPQLSPAEPSPLPIRPQPATEKLINNTNQPDAEKIAALKNRLHQVNTQIVDMQAELAENRIRLEMMQSQLQQLLQGQAGQAGTVISNTPPPLESPLNTEAAQTANTAPTNQEPPQTSANPNAIQSAESSTSITSRWPLYLSALLLAALLSWIALKRRKTAIIENSDIELEPLDSTTVQALHSKTDKPKEVESSNTRYTNGEPEWLQIAANDVQGKKSDPLLDANIFLVYGRLDEASRLLENALRQDPERVDLRLLQLKLFQQQNNRQRFEEAANHLEPLIDAYERRQIGQLRQKFTG